MCNFCNALPWRIRSDSMHRLKSNTILDTHRDTAAIRDIARDLKAAIAGEVRFDDSSRALYATDGCNYRQPPVGVVIPRSQEDVIATVQLARHYDVPILGRGCGTSLAGQCCNTAVVIDMSKYLNQVNLVGRKRPAAKQVEPNQFLDNSLVQELVKEGFFTSLWGQDLHSKVSTQQ